jgi:threonine aldolase
MEVIDLRSDTVTKPTPEMRRAMFEAEVGDDGYGEDPTVRKLEELAAGITGKEAAVFVASGTMGNQAAVMAHTRRCDTVICEASAHIMGAEGGAMAGLSGAQPLPLVGEHGRLAPGQIEDAIKTDKKRNVSRTALIALENTHNKAGGTYYTPAQLEAIKRVAAGHLVPVHMDGARIFNAAVAQGVAVSALTQHADSVQFCLSKGLSAPVGSVLVGSKEFIFQARRARTVLGGSMRQAGILAAAGIVALTTMVERLAEDHVHARMLAEAIADTNLKIDLAAVQTNIVIFDVSPLGMMAVEFVRELGAQNIRANEYGKYIVRLVTHKDVSRPQIEYAIAVLTRLGSKRTRAKAFEG